MTHTSAPQVLCVRMSAIGDLVMLGHSLDRLAKSGAEPVVLTHPNLIPVAQRFLSLSKLLTFDGKQWQAFARKGASRFWEQILHETPTPASSPEILEWLGSLQAIIDFQSTPRSRRAIRTLGEISPGHRRVFRVPKDRLRRLMLIARSSFRRQNLPKDVRKNAGAGAGAKTRLKISVPSRLPKDPTHRVQQSYQSTVEQCLKALSLGPKDSENQQKGPSGLWSSRDIRFETRPLPPAIPRVDCILFSGASLPLKLWPLENSAEFINTLLKAGKTVAIAGGEAEISFAKELESLCPGSVNVTGTCDLGQTIDLIATAKCVVTTDSFPGHVCDLVSTPCLILFGATSPDFGFVPLSSGVRTARVDLGCSPCTRHGRGRCRWRNHACMREIRGQDIATEVLQILGT